MFKICSAFWKGWDRRECVSFSLLTQRREPPARVFGLPSCAFLAQGISHSAECGQGRCPRTPETFEKGSSKL